VLLYNYIFFFWAEAEEMDFGLSYGGCRCRHCRPTRRFSFNFAYDKIGFNGLLFIWGSFKK
jgi:hypothetical protein